MKKNFSRILFTIIVSGSILSGLIYLPYVELWEIDYTSPDKYNNLYFVNCISAIAFEVLVICIYKLSENIQLLTNK